LVPNPGYNLFSQLHIARGRVRCHRVGRGCALNPMLRRVSGRNALEDEQISDESGSAQQGGRVVSPGAGSLTGFRESTLAKRPRLVVTEWFSCI
jgi:hypothetical protein